MYVCIDKIKEYQKRITNILNQIIKSAYNDLVSTCTECRTQKFQNRFFNTNQQRKMTPITADILKPKHAIGQRSVEVEDIPRKMETYSFHLTTERMANVENV